MEAHGKAQVAAATVDEHDPGNRIENPNKRKREAGLYFPNSNEYRAPNQMDSTDLLRALRLGMINQPELPSPSSFSSLEGRAHLPYFLAGETAMMERSRQSLPTLPSTYANLDFLLRNSGVIEDPSKSLAQHLALSRIQGLIQPPAPSLHSATALSLLPPILMNPGLIGGGMQSAPSSVLPEYLPFALSNVVSSLRRPGIDADFMGLPLLSMSHLVTATPMAQTRVSGPCFSRELGDIKPRLEQILDSRRLHSEALADEERQRKRPAIAPALSLQDNLSSVSGSSALVALQAARLIQQQQQQQQGENASKTNEPPPKEIMLLAIPEDHVKLNEQQIFLRCQIEVFRATPEDVVCHTRGRNKPIVVGQVGIRCKHCGSFSSIHRRKGSTYFPSALMGLYQASQNMSVEHLQSGICTKMPEEVKQQFLEYAIKKPVPSGAGRPYWADSGRKLGLIDTEFGIRFAGE